MKREDVFTLINGERAYQDSKWDTGRPLSDQKTPVAAWLLYIEEHLNQAKAMIYYLREDQSLEQVRKITALGVACMENNNTEARKDN